MIIKLTLLGATGLMILSGCATSNSANKLASTGDLAIVKVIDSRPTEDISTEYYIYGANECTVSNSSMNCGVLFLTKNEKDSCSEKGTTSALRVWVFINSEDKEENHKIISYILNAYANSEPIKAEMEHLSRDVAGEHTVRMTSIPRSELDKEIQLVDMATTPANNSGYLKLGPGHLEDGHCVGREKIQHVK